MNLEELYGTDILSDADPEYLEEGDQVAGLGGALLRLGKTATKPNPLRNRSTFENLRQMAESGIDYRMGKAPNLPAVDYIDDPYLRLLGVPADQMVLDGMHRSTIGGMLEIPIRGYEHILLPDPLTGKMEILGPSGVRLPFNPANHGANLGLTAPSSLFSSKIWTPDLDAQQGASFARELTGRDKNAINIIDEVSKGGELSEADRFFPAEYATDAFGHPSATNDHGHMQRLRMLAGDAARRGDIKRMSQQDIVESVADESLNPFHRYLAETMLEKPYIQSASPVGGVNVPITNARYLEEDILKKLQEKGWSPAWSYGMDDAGGEAFKRVR